MLLQLTNELDEKLIINFDNVDYFIKSGSGTDIHINSKEEPIYVKNEYDKIKSMIELKMLSKNISENIRS